MREFWEEVRVPFYFSLTMTTVVIAVVCGLVLLVTSLLPVWAQIITLGASLPVLALGMIFGTFYAMDRWG